MTQNVSLRKLIDVKMDENGNKVVVVAVKASKEISRNEMEWALTHVVQPGNCVKLLIVICPQTFGKSLSTNLSCFIP